MGTKYAKIVSKLSFFNNSKLFFNNWLKESENESSDYYFSDKSDSENIDVLVMVNFWII